MVALQPSHLPEAAEILDILNKIEFEVHTAATAASFKLIELQKMMIVQQMTSLHPSND